jgi:hypothetical protein
MRLRAPFGLLDCRRQETAHLHLHDSSLPEFLGSLQLFFHLQEIRVPTQAAAASSVARRSGDKGEVAVAGAGAFALWLAADRHWQHPNNHKQVV